MIDTHAHLSKRFCSKPIVEGIRVVLAASNIEDSRENIALAKDNSKQFLASVGIHPQQTDPENQKTIEAQVKELEEIVKQARGQVFAIGETGLDFSTAGEGEATRPKDAQIILFGRQIELGIKYQLPLIVHSRKSMDETLDFLEKYPKARGVIHCYTGGKKRIDRVVGLKSEWFFGIDGNLTYEDGLAQVVAAIPKERLVLETDSPFLAPIPHRLETNRPEYVKYVYEKVAQIWQTDLAKTENIIDANAKKLFGYK